VKEEKAAVSTAGCRMLSYNNELFDLESLKREKDYAISSATGAETVNFNFCDKFVDMKRCKSGYKTHGILTKANYCERLTSQTHRPASI